MEVDVVVIGSGAAGLTSAVVAAKAGLTVLVTEKAPFFGGTTAYSLGAAWIIGNPHQHALGVDDNHEAGVQYLKNALGPLYDPNKVRAYVESPIIFPKLAALAQVGRC
jgi:succinate dehydrogenase/fumarate reductase flavoprotein subunit